jgi:hypothetical protein
MDLKKGGLARIRVTAVNTTTSTTPIMRGELRWLITPRLMKIISKT